MAPPVPVDVPQVPPHKRKLHFLEYTDSESDGDDDLTAPATLSGEESLLYVIYVSASEWSV